MGNIKLSNGLNIENAMFGSTQIQKIYMGTTLIFPDCTLDIIGWDNITGWKPITLYRSSDNTSLALFHNGTGAYPIVGDTIATALNPTTTLNGASPNGEVWYEPNEYYYYIINGNGVITQKYLMEIFQ